MQLCLPRLSIGCCGSSSSPANCPPGGGGGGGLACPLIPPTSGMHCEAEQSCGPLNLELLVWAKHLRPAGAGALDFRVDMVPLGIDWVRNMNDQTWWGCTLVLRSQVHACLCSVFAMRVACICDACECKQEMPAA
jgi:hypothetical protein